MSREIRRESIISATVSKRWQADGRKVRWDAPLLQASHCRFESVSCLTDLSICCVGKDVYWYTREKGDTKVGNDEVQAVKQQEEQLMAEVLSHFQHSHLSMAA